MSAQPILPEGPNPVSLGGRKTIVQDESHYPYYGAPILAKICEKYGFPVPDDFWVENMIKGNPCSDACGEGCL